MPSFNVVDKPWIPCLPLGQHRPVELSLREVLARAPELLEIVDPSPLITIALHRLLLAVLRRNFGPEGVDGWEGLWERGRLDAEALTAYFETWGDRFDLFDDRHPFYQTPGLEREDAKPISQLTPELASSGNAMLLFDHTTDPCLTPAQAARYLLAFQAFDVSGTKSCRKDEPISHKYSDAGPLTKNAVALAKGRNLFETLMLNLHGFSRPEVAVLEGEDLPAWERDSPTEPADRNPAGHIDVLTWQSRRIRLFPEQDASGSVVVRHAAIMKGYQFPSLSSRKDLETMVAFRKQPRAKPGEEPWQPVSFQVDRALWRDSLALFQRAGDNHARPKILDWLSRLVREDVLNRATVMPLDVYGVTTDPKNQANVLFWRHERLPLPLAYLEDTERGRRLLDAVKDMLRLAEDVGSLFQTGFLPISANGKPAMAPRPMQVLASLLAAPTEQRQPRKDDLRPIIEHLAPGRHYWPRLEVPFKELLIEMARDPAAEHATSWSYGAGHKARWAAILRRVAWDAFEATVQGLDESPRTMKAVARAQQEFGRRLSVILKGYQSEAVRTPSAIA